METRFGNTVLANDFPVLDAEPDSTEYISMDELKQTSFSVQESEERLTRLIHSHYSAKL